MKLVYLYYKTYRICLLTTERPNDLGQWGLVQISNLNHADNTKDVSFWLTLWQLEQDIAGELRHFYWVFVLPDHHQHWYFLDKLIRICSVGRTSTTDVIIVAQNDWKKIIIYFFMFPDKKIRQEHLKHCNVQSSLVHDLSRVCRYGRWTRVATNLYVTKSYYNFMSSYADGILRLTFLTWNHYTFIQTSWVQSTVYQHWFRQWHDLEK